MLTSTDCYRFVGYSIGDNVPFCKILTSEEWTELYDFAQRQAIIGVVLEGVSRLREEQDQSPPVDLLLKWIGMVEQVKLQNQLLNDRTVETVKHFEQAGFDSVILKGQGNGLYYPNPLVRMPGDIDVWLVADHDRVRQHVKELYPNAIESERHIEYPLFEEIHVEVHFYPSTSSTPKHNRKLKEFFKTHAKQQLKHKVKLIGTVKDVCMPTKSFNIVVQLSHMLGHLLIEGFGMKQVVDFYYLLQQKDDLALDWEVTLRSLGLYNFARGMMWFLHHEIGLDRKFLIVETSEKIGRMIAKEVYECGNMGYYDERYKEHRMSYLSRGVADVYRLLIISSVLPDEAVWRILWKVKNQFRYRF